MHTDRCTCNITSLLFSGHTTVLVYIRNLTCCADGVQFSLNGTIYKNNSLVTLENIGDGHNSLLCITNLTACCRSPYTNGSAIGNWFFPNGTRVPSSGNGDIYRTRGQMVVNMRWTIGGEDGIYHCVILDAENVNQTMYIGVYTVSTGEWYMYTSVLFNYYSLQLSDYSIVAILQQTSRYTMDCS